MNYNVFRGDDYLTQACYLLLNFSCTVKHLEEFEEMAHQHTRGTGVPYNGVGVGWGARAILVSYLWKPTFPFVVVVRQS